MQSECISNKPASTLQEPTTVDYFTNVFSNIFLLRPLDPKYVPNSYTPSLLLISLIVTVYFLLSRRDKLYDQNKISILQFYGTTIKKMFSSQASLQSFFVEFFIFTVAMIIGLAIEILKVSFGFYCISFFASMMLKTEHSPMQFAIVATGVLFIYAIRMIESELSPKIRKLAKYAIIILMTYNFYINYSQYCNLKGVVNNPVILMLVASSFSFLELGNSFTPFEANLEIELPSQNPVADDSNRNPVADDSNRNLVTNPVAN